MVSEGREEERTRKRNRLSVPAEATALYIHSRPFRLFFLFQKASSVYMFLSTQPRSSSSFSASSPSSLFTSTTSSCHSRLYPSSGCSRRRCQRHQSYYGCDTASLRRPDWKMHTPTATGNDDHPAWCGRKPNERRLFRINAVGLS